MTGTKAEVLTGQGMQKRPNGKIQRKKQNERKINTR